jgi:uncharacterized protein
MKLELSRIRQAQDRFDRTFSPSEVAQDGDMYSIVAPVHLGFDIHKDKDKFRLVGNLRTELELTCSRCLEPFRMPVDVAFDQRYLPQSEVKAEADAEIEVEENDLETSFYQDDQIDLNELMREQFYLTLPMKPLCTEGCKGLCAQCGTNLNTGTCDCAPVWEDPRLAALKQFKPRSNA